ncbi:hypothetical protein RSOL_508880 [Rhizoctonia solani AG-3 Rhs1AP]|uniref:BTB/POZ domain protein n=2 Tax=Rhizoctonia solani AG-3 TaxID=1086053 RepID=A0A074S4Q4_9AGAM|nr:hypothetical protein RSOL_508880 [Rhizoctonia solani AG-3 Rhs1AP]KEP52565.1 hypothetical protein V565_043300 [Rhizoctonia solani 123E]
MGGASAEDFMRMLRVLYSTTLEGPFEFDIPTLVSSLQIATEYEYPALRNYAIKHLERAELTAIKRIEIARKFDLPSWEKPAFMDLCNRDESITEEEANILGVAAFLRVTEIREREQRRRGSRVDVEREGKAIKSELAEVDLNQGTDGPPSPGDKDAPREIPPCLGGKRSSKLNPLNWTNEANAEATKVEGMRQHLSLALEHFR